jgi:hypothetical protein
MLSSKLVIRQCSIAAALLAAALLAPAAADAKIKVSVLGWTTQALGTSPQVTNDKTIDTCMDMGNGQRSLYVVYKGKGIKKNIKVGVGVWGGPPSAGSAAEPTTADMKSAFKWPVNEKKSFTTRYGFSFAKGPFGPQQINGVWNAKIVIKSKVVARGKVTVAC